jgi:hypothetical protein
MKVRLMLALLTAALILGCAEAPVGKPEIRE